METITPQWNRSNLDKINRNFQTIGEIPEQVNKEINNAKSALEYQVNDFFEPQKNLFNRLRRFLNDTTITSGGKLISRADYSTTDFAVSIQPSTSYQSTTSYYYSQWDRSGNFLKYGFVAYKTALITEANADSIRIAIPTSSIDRFMFAEGTAALTSDDYQDYQAVLKGVNDAQVLEASEGHGTIAERFEGIESAISEIGGGSILEVSDEEAEAVFSNTMNEVAKRIGMINSKFVNSTGLTGVGQLTTAEDLALLAKYACGYETLLRIWGADNYTFSTKGQNARSVSITTSVTDNTFENTYTILGGKTGTLGVNINLTGVFLGNDGKIYAASILRADSDRWIAMKQMLDGETTIEATGGCAYELQGVGPLYQNVPSPIFNSKAPQTKIAPASCTKVLTAIVLLESGIKLDETITLKASDIQTGSGPLFTAGEKISVLDALYLMMLPSSNTAAKAIGRVVGKEIILTRGYK